MTRLEVGRSTWLSVTGDFADQSGVLLPASYLAFESLMPSVGTISSNGRVFGLNSGTTILRVSSHGIQAVTALAVGTPTDQTELLLYAAGLDVVPEAVTLSTDGSRQLFVTMAGGINISEAITGTLYFAGNPEVATVTADGLVSAVAEGITEITIINAAAEVVISVQVIAPVAGPTVIGPDGGIVEGADGQWISIAPGGVLEDTPISLDMLDSASLSWMIPEPYIFAAAFDLNVGDEVLWIAPQLGIPVASGIAAGTEVVFCEFRTIQDETGVEVAALIQVDRGVVGVDGLVLTETSVMPGVLRSGSYLVAYAPEGTTGAVQFELELQNPMSPLSEGFFVGIDAPANPIPSPLKSLASANTFTADKSLSSILYGCYYYGYAYGYMHLPTGPQQIETLELTDPDILPNKTTTNVSINPGAVTKFTTIIDNSMVPPDHPSGAPLITSVSFSFEGAGNSVQPTITIEGERLQGRKLKLLFFEAGSERAIYIEGADLTVVNNNTLKAVGPGHIRGVDGVMPIESCESGTLEGPDSKMQRDE